MSVRCGPMKHTNKLGIEKEENGNIKVQGIPSIMKPSAEIGVTVGTLESLTLGLIHHNLILKL